MLVLVDGTGSDNDTEYHREMAGSFCRRLEKKCSSRYWRGPVMGHETVVIADRVVAAVLEWRQGPGARQPLFLVGHSRGGAAVIFAACELKSQNVVVNARAPRLLIDSDRAAMADVESWMAGDLAKHGVYATN